MSKERFQLQNALFDVRFVIFQLLFFMVLYKVLFPTRNAFMKREYEPMFVISKGREAG